MRPSFILPLVWAMSSTVGAFKDRGAAERYAWWLTYLAEELLPESERTIAKDCVGSLNGPLGSSTRCNFMDFCDHIWKTSPKNTPAGQPQQYFPAVDKDKQAWPSAGKMQKGWDFPYNQVVDWTLGVKQKVTGPDGKVKEIKIPGPGFTGLINAEKLVGGPANWYEMMANWGDRVKAPQKALEERLKLAPGEPGALSDDQKSQLKKLFETKIPNAAKYASELRLKSRSTNWISPPNGYDTLSQKLGHDVVVEKRTTNFEGKVLSYDYVDRMKTADAMKGAFGDDIAKAIDHFDTVVKDINDHDMGFDGKPKAHQRAIDALDKFEDDVRRITTPCSST